MSETRTVEIDQGDVFFIKAKIPADAKPVGRKLRGLVLAEGEVTGHAHVVEDVGAELFEGSNGEIFLQVDDECVALKHEEHNPVVASRGEWQIGIVQEYDPFEEEVRKVQD